MTMRTLPAALLLLAGPARADDPPVVDAPAGAAAYAGESAVLFVRRVSPLLTESCAACHGKDAEAVEGGFNLLTAAPTLAGGDSGEPGVVPGKPDESSLYLAATRDHYLFSAMPPKESEALTAEELGWLKRWIETGAAWPNEARFAEIAAEYADEWSVEDGVTVTTSGGLDDKWTNRRYDPAGLWAYQPLKEVEVPAGAGSAVDYLIEKAMPEGLEAAPRADRRTLARRASFDLTGLPPTPAEVGAFVNDPADPADDGAAFAALVDRLLASPHYGERMAQHWLDVTRYADSSGFANDYERGNAWRYRDYVVRAFNDDKPYDEFVREQIAGDELDPDDPEGLIAAGFLRQGPWELTGMEVAKVARQRFLDDVTNSVGETFLGQSLQCCRCHDHKFDPLPTRDYYAFQAVFATTQLAERRAPFLPEENTGGFDELRYLKLREAEYRATLDELDAVLLDNAEAWFAEHGGDVEAWRKAVAEAEKTGHGPRGAFNAARNKLMRSGVPQTELPPKQVGFTPRQFGLERVARKGLERLRWEADRYEPVALSVYDGHTRALKSVNAPQRIPEDRTRGEFEKSFIHTGGDPFSEGEPVSPGALSLVEDQVPADIPDGLEGRRAALADWIADPRNPLTARVLVNRVWQWHFGRALAGNPNNFGSTGKRPTHPDLLDKLAADFLAGGGSIKELHRAIMNSDAYARGASHPDRASLIEKDPSYESYAVFLPRRLTAEELRDSMLRVSGELNPALGGIPRRPIINNEVALQPRQVMGTFAAAWTPDPKPEQRNRRSIYVLKLRGLVDPALEVFNAPSPDFSCERRDASTVTPQVFAMFNSANTSARALALADLATRHTETPADAVRLIYRRLFAREATDREVKMCLAHRGRILSLLPETPPGRPAPPREVVREAVEENTGETFTFTETLYAIDDFEPDLRPADVDRATRALADVCLVLMNGNEFVYVY